MKRIVMMVPNEVYAIYAQAAKELEEETGVILSPKQVASVTARSETVDSVKKAYLDTMKDLVSTASSRLSRKGLMRKPGEDVS